LIFVPFAATMIGVLIGKIHEMTPQSFSIRTWTVRRSSFRLSMVVLAFSLIFSAYVVEATREAWSIKPSLNPTQYEVEAILYIDRNTEGKYVVVGDAVFRYLAQGILGFKSRGTYLYYTYFGQLLTRPSVDVMVNVMNEANASVAFFVVSNRLQNPSLDTVVTSTKEVLDIYAILGEGKLYIFSYPGVEPEMAIPLEIDSGNETRINYVLEYEVNWTRELQLLPRAHLDSNSVRVVASDGSEVPSQHENFQGWFDDCSTSANWSEGSSDNDVLTFTAHFNATTIEMKRLTYTEFDMSGGDLRVDASKYKYLEIKWRVNFEKIASIRVDLWNEGVSGWKSMTTWATPSMEWKIWRFDISSLVNDTLGGLYFDVFKSKPYTWQGDFMVYIDWIRFVGDTGIVRFLYNGTANSVEQYRIEYNTLENTESGNEDGLPKPSYSDAIFSTDQDTGNPPSISSTVPVSLTIRAIDLLNQPISEVTVDVLARDRSTYGHRWMGTGHRS